MTHSYNLRPRKQLKYTKEQINEDQINTKESVSMDMDVKEMTELTENLQLNNTEERVVEKMRIMTLNDLEYDIYDIYDTYDTYDTEYDPENEVTSSESWCDELKTQPSSGSDNDLDTDSDVEITDIEQFDEYEYDLDYEINLSDNSILGKRKYIDEYVF